MEPAERGGSMSKMSDYGRCTRCGAALIPGANWYTMKLDKVCCNCSSWPRYSAPVQGEPYGSYLEDAEEAILERQDSWFDDCFSLFNL